MADKQRANGRENRGSDYNQVGGAARNGPADQREEALEVLREMEADPVLAALIGAALLGHKPSGSEEDEPSADESSAAVERNRAFVKELLRSRRSGVANTPAKLRLAAAPSEQVPVQPARKPRLVWSSEGVDVFVNARGDVLVDERHQRVVVGGASYDAFLPSEHPGLKRIAELNWGSLREQLAQREG